MAFSRNRILPGSQSWCCGSLLGGIFIYAGYVKLVEPWQLFAAGIADYEVVPMWAAKFLAHTLPWFEVVDRRAADCGPLVPHFHGEHVPAAAGLSSA